MHAKTPALLRNNHEKMHREMSASFDSWRKSPYVSPDGVFGKKLSILGGRIIVYHPGSAQTQDNLVVYFPYEKILYGGTLISYPPMFLNKINLKHYDPVLKSLRKFDFDIVISGHGKAVRDIDIIGKLRKRISEMEKEKP